MRIFGIDPGNTESAYIVTDDYKPLEFGKKPNNDVRIALEEWKQSGIEHVLIERIARMGMPVGRDVFETCEWIGRFTEIADRDDLPVDYIYRRDEKINLCGSPQAKDTNIMRALIDRFAKHDIRSGKGRKKKPDFFTDSTKTYRQRLRWL